MEKLNYLTALLPSDVSASFELVKRLNNKGLKPTRKPFYTESIVNNVINGKTNDVNIKPELIAWLQEIYTPQELKRKIKAWQSRGTRMMAELL